jgi:hypothetical protein
MPRKKKKGSNNDNNTLSSINTDRERESAFHSYASTKSSSTAMVAASSGPAASAKKRLLQQLGKELVQYQESTSSRPNCAFYTMSDWFGNEGLDLSASEPDMLAQLVQELQAKQLDTANAATATSESASPKNELLMPQLRQRVS